MDTAVASLEPRALWEIFAALSRIPRASGAEAAATAWIMARGRELGCEVAQDAVGNVRLRAPASPGREGRPSVALQAHVDMVCEKDEGTVHDFAHDAIRLVREGDHVRADGTTLGADNGIGVAAALAVVADPSVVHGPLEILVTVDEESGLTGATNLAPGWLGSSLLLNLDSEEDGELTIGCAGGIDTVAAFDVRRAAPPSGARPFRVKVAGLLGGHSGGDVHLGRGNANRVLAMALQALDAPVARIQGGGKRNAIPREASAVVWLPDDVAARALLADLADGVRASLGAADPGLEIGIEPTEPLPPFADDDRRAIVRFLLAAPHGVEAMSPDIPGLVQTSTNMGVVTTEGDRVEVNFMTRSSVEPAKRALVARIDAVAALAGFAARHQGDYPGWKPEPGAALVRRVDEAHRALTGKPLVVRAIHAGLECGLIGEKHPGMQMVSFGPTIRDAHTPREWVSISSVATFWQLLRAVLADV